MLRFIYNHPEGIKGALATSAAVFLARMNKSKNEIRQYIANTFKYDLTRKIKDIRMVYYFDETCQGSVPEAIIAFLESTDFEDAIRLAISSGGDSDTIVCICGSIAEAYYKDIPEHIVNNSPRVLPNNLIEQLERFSYEFRS